MLCRQFGLKCLHRTVKSNYESTHLIHVKFRVSFLVVFSEFVSSVEQTLS